MTSPESPEADTMPEIVIPGIGKLRPLGRLSLVPDLAELHQQKQVQHFGKDEEGDVPW